MAGVATEKPVSHRWLKGACVCYSLIGRKIKPSTLFICSLKLSVDTEKLMFQKAALNRPGIPEL